MSVQPGSLVFLVIMAIWAAYFLQHWVRRREHMATARSIEEFSDSMRVLERRGVLPASSLSEPAPDSYAVRPTRSTRPVVTVKRAEEAPSAGAYAADRSQRADRPTATGASVTGASAARPVRRTAPAAQTGGPSRRALGLTLLASVAMLVVLVPVVALTALTWPFALLPVLTGGYAVAALRMRVQTQARARRAGHRRTPELRVPARQHRNAPVPTRPVEPAAGRAADTATVATADAREQVFDLAALEPAPAVAPPASGAAPAARRPARRPVLEQPATPELDEDDMPLTWDPVPVPRPTYTMKAPAPRRATAPAAPAEQEQPIASAPRRRVVGE